MGSMWRAEVLLDLIWGGFRTFCKPSFSCAQLLKSEDIPALMIPVGQLTAQH